MRTITPAELVDVLEEFEIQRTERTLRSWREKGLLPPLQLLGRTGRTGIRREWDETVIDQSIATHYLLGRYAKTEEALLSLWSCGFEIDHVRAQQAWIRHLERIRDYRSRRASEFVEGRFGFGRSIWRSMPENSRLQLFTQEGFEEFIDWLYDPERDDSTDSTILAEPLSVVFGRTESGLPSVESYDTAKLIWDVFRPAELFGPTSSIAFVISLTESELLHAHRTLGAVWRVLKHLISLQTTSRGYQWTVDGAVRVMQDSGLFASKLLI